MNRIRSLLSLPVILGLGLMGTLLFLGCKSGDPGGSSSGSCSGGSVIMLDDSETRPFCEADAKPSIEMTASTLNCSPKSPTSPIVVNCNGGPGDWSQCEFEEFTFGGLSLDVASTFSGEFLCGGVSSYTVVFEPASELGTKSDHPTVKVYFEGSSR